MIAKTIRLAASVALGLASGDLFSAEQVELRPESPRIRALEESLDRGEPNAERDFWNDVRAKGSPLGEPIEGRSGYARMTFLWKGSTKTRNVRLISGPQILRHFRHLNFVHLPKSDVWFLTLDIPAGWRVAYLLAENADPHGFPKTVQSDPLNPLHSDLDPADSGAGLQQYSIFETLGAPPEPWLRRHEGVAAGTTEMHRIHSLVLGRERTVVIYVPHGYRSFDGRIGSIYLFDGEEYSRDMRISEVLDNLIGERRIAPLIAVLIQDLTGSDRDRELSSDPNFANFLTTELVPWVRANFPVSEDPQRTIIGGSSLGGLEAVFVASRRPDLFGAVLAQSGSFWWQPGPPSAGNLEPWMAGQFEKGAKFSVRFFLSVGRDELNQSGLEGGLIDNRRMRETLVNRGYDVKYEEIEGQHDWINWRLTLPNGLISLDPVAGR